MVMSLTHGGPTMYATGTPATAVAVGTIGGLVWFERDGLGKVWRQTRVALAGQHISAALLEERSGTLFAGAYVAREGASGGLHASTDGGKTWERREHGLTEHNVYAISIAYHGARTRLYVGTEPAHLFVSEDLGRTWQDLPAVRSVPGTTRWTFPAPPHVAHVKHINFDPHDPATVYVSIEQGGLLKSTDEGRTFHEIAGMDDDVHRTIIYPDGKQMFVTGGAGIYATANGGVSWEHRTTNQDDQVGGYPDQLVFVPSRPSTMVIAGAHRSPGAWRTSHAAGSRIHRSEDGGRSWTQLGRDDGAGLPDRLDSSVEAMALHEWPGGVSLFAGTTAGEVFVSDDCGTRWAQIASGLGAISKGGHYHALETATVR